jgi:hypothetical protein
MTQSRPKAEQSSKQQAASNKQQAASSKINPRLSGLKRLSSEKSWYG